MIGFGSKILVLSALFRLLQQFLGGWQRFFFLSVLVVVNSDILVCCLCVGSGILVLEAVFQLTVGFWCK